MRPARLAAARESDARLARGAPRSPLEGVPLSIKDSIHAAGLPSTWGSRALADYRPDIDELPVARLRAAGAIILGKTNVPELTLEGYTSNDLFGVTRNPWDTRLTPGGSSGGAAASVAAGLVPGAIGADGGGSIRRPACHTGLVGWKPSTGHVPRIDGFPAILTDFETIGTLTRTVDDALMLDSVLAGPDARDRRSLYAAAPPWAVERPRIVYIPKFGEGPVDPEVARVVADFARSLEREGHEVKEAPVFFDLEDAARIWHVVSRAGRRLADAVEWGSAQGRRRRFRARDGGGRPQARGRRLYRRARARRRFAPALRGTVSKRRARPHADRGRSALAGGDAVSRHDRRRARPGRATTRFSPDG